MRKDLPGRLCPKSQENTYRRKARSTELDVREEPSRMSLASENKFRNREVAGDLGKISLEDTNVLKC